MYDRHIDVKNGLIFVDEIHYIEKADLSALPKDVTFYCEYEGDWWIERKPFNGREKNEDIRHVALQLLDEAESLWKELKAADDEYVKNLEQNQTQ